jgi:hypothetical protein
MADTLTNIRQALADAIQSRIDGIQVSPWLLANPTPPAAHVFPAQLSYHQAFGNGMETWEFTLQVFVSENAGDIGSQQILDRYLSRTGPSSIKAALEDDLTLGGVISDLTVTQSSGYRQYMTQGRANVLGAEWTINVIPADEE